ncbi:Myosin light chain kinase, smooth muscle [Merluccius polli]|uniref:Myosin light chain kinase, smooth muscle n=1 Tax=Merluccius polli TaxID=89951 RepID=A0AA47MPP7_MERPO|nr:Myosin light chain kinase, smooth muscle [Merluccius polli]
MAAVVHLSWDPTRWVFRSLRRGWGCEDSSYVYTHLLYSINSRAIATRQPVMNGVDGKQKQQQQPQRYVSTFSMVIKPPPPSLRPTEGAKRANASPRTPGSNRVGSKGKDGGAAVREGIVAAEGGMGEFPTTSQGPDAWTPPSGPDPPIFLKPLRDCSVEEGADITLSGVIAGTKPINVSWLHNERVEGACACVAVHLFAHPPQCNNSEFDETIDIGVCPGSGGGQVKWPILASLSCDGGGEVRFLVKECLPEDAGIYTCLAENGAGRTSSCASVSVREVVPKKRATSDKAPVPVQFEKPPQHVEVKVGECARLTCAFSGSPPIAACWIRNNQQVADTEAELWTESRDRSSTLVIAAARPQHAGPYTVLVRDRRSSAQHTVTLSVIEKPQPPASGPLVSLVSRSGLVLSWSGPCYDGGSAVQGYVVEVSGQGSHWRKLSDRCKSTSYRVTAEQLPPQTDYCFRVRAYNAVGPSEPSPESLAVRMEAAASGGQEEEEPAAAFVHVTVDCVHKASDHYNVLEKLGVGKFGQVFKLVHKESARECAGKFYKGRRAKEREAARREIELMNLLHHPKLVQCLAAYEHRSEMVMVMELIEGGELFERIVDDGFEHTEVASVRYIQQILEGVAYMHQQDIIHLDLKPENIVCVDHTGTGIKIIDFGLASKLDPKVPLMVMHGTPEFVAPEVINYERVSFATDMWSIGVICYILLSGESPFQGNSDEETLASVTSAQWEFDDESFEDISEEAKGFISSLLIKDPRQRLSAEKAQAHPWIAASNCADPSQAKILSKNKMKRFLARQKWKKAGKAMLALQRITLCKSSENPSSPVSAAEESPLSPEAQQALLSLEDKMQGPPQFSRRLEDQAVSAGSTVRLSCHLTGYPDPEVVWLCGSVPVAETSRVQIEYEEDGGCTLVVTQAGPQDADVYTCTATNDHGEARCSAKLTVNE